MHGHYVAESAYRVLRFVRLNEGVPYRDSLAKYATALFRMSRSSLTRFKLVSRRQISAALRCMQLTSFGFWHAIAL